MKLKELNKSVQLGEMIGGVNKVNNYNPYYNDPKEHPFQKLIMKAKAIVENQHKFVRNEDSMVNAVMSDKGVKFIITTFPQGKLMASQSKTLENIIIDEYNKYNSGPVEIYA